jgi:Tol biopolymer transport system component
LGFSTVSRASTPMALLQNRLDPHDEFRTLETAHFLIHYPTYLEELALRMGNVAENSYSKVTDALGLRPENRTHIVVVAQSDEPAIATISFPMNLIFFDVTPPNEAQGINDYTDFHDWVITHEFTHVVHLQTREGIYKALGSIFGPWVNPNLGTPAWLKEGLAVYLESTLTPHGRGGASTYRMMMRSAVADGNLRSEDFATLDRTANFEDVHWPWSVRPYLFGYYMVRTLVQNNSRGLSSLPGGTAHGVPFSLSGLLEGTPFRNFSDFWKATLTEIEKESREEIRTLQAKPFTPLEYLSDTGLLYSGLTLSPDGKTLAVTHDQPNEDNAIFTLKIEGEVVSKPSLLVTRSTGSQTSFSKSSRFLLFDQTARSQHYYQMSDLYIYDLKKKEIISSSPYLRARDPDAAPDGKHVVFIANTDGQNTLMVSDTNWENRETLYSPSAYGRMMSPRYSPDGKAIAFAIRNANRGGQDIAILRDQALEYIVEDGAYNTGLSWTRDGKYLLYSSDRTGVTNIYAYEFSSRRTYQISHVLGGLFSPNLDPNHKWVYAISYRGKGYDVARFPWDPSKWTVVDVAAPISKSQPYEPPFVASKDQTSDYRSSRYLFPQFIRPSVSFYPYTHQFGFQTSAIDPLFLHTYALDLRYDTASSMPVGDFAYYDLAHLAPWTFNVQHQVVTTHSGSSGLVDGSLTFYIPLSTDSNSTYLTPGLIGLAPNTGRFGGFYNPSAGAHLGFRYDTQFKDLSSSFYQYGNLVDVDFRQLFSLSSGGPSTTYMTTSLSDHRNGFYPRHFIHAEFQGAAIFAGLDSTFAYFGVAGTQSFPLNSPNGYFLYGYAPDRVTRSPSLGIANLVYTLPILEIQHGVGVAPIYFGRLSLGLRTQAAAIELPSGGAFMPWSYGAEFYQDIVAGQVFGMTARLGFYNAPKSLGGDFQTLFSLSSNDF